MEDPLRLLYITGGSGGLWFWISQWRGRTRIIVRVLDKTNELRENPEMNAFLALEIVNVGDRPTSLEPKICFRGFDQHRKQIRGKFRVEEQDKSLEPHIAREFGAVAKLDTDFFFTVYQTYDIQLTRGSGVKLRFRSISFTPISPARFFAERLIFRKSGWFPDER